MKKVILNMLIPILLMAGLTGCKSPVAMGNWENIQKNPDNTTVVTTLAINEIGSTFDATMEAKIEGMESENLKLPVKIVKFSGYLSGKNLNIDQVDSDSSELSYYTSLKVSDDGKFLTLNPGKIKFQKK